MKKSTLGLLFSLVLILGAVSTSQADDGFIPREVDTLPDQVFVPPGFDDNDNSQIVVHGNFMNTCYQVAPAKVRVDHEKRKIFVENKSFYFEGCYCLEVLVPYTKTIDVGALHEGNYQVLVKDQFNQWNDMETINVARSDAVGPGPDDIYYAPVDEVTVANPHGRTTEVTLSGNFTSNCMELKNIRVLQRKSNIIEVLPEVEITSEVCNPVLVPFSRTFTVENLDKGVSLVHVRALNGQAVNRVVKVDDLRALR